jgi:hypothetical protein
MEHLGEIALYSVGALALAWLVLSVSGSWPVLSMSHARLEPLGDKEARSCLETVLALGAVDTQWAAAHHFQPAGAYRATHLAAKVVAWTQEGEPSYLCVYLIFNARTETEFITVCGEKVLATGRTKDTHLFPTPRGSWQQSFSTSSIGELWSLHLEASKYLSEITDFRPAKYAPNLQDDFTRAMRREAEHVRSLPLWPLRIPYWYFVRRNALHNKSIRQLMER